MVILVFGLIWAKYTAQCGRAFDWFIDFLGESMHTLGLVAKIAFIAFVIGLVVGVPIVGIIIAVRIGLYLARYFGI